MNSFKKCPNGHIYNPELAECPYCNGSKIDDDLDDLPDKTPVNKDILKNMADCYMMGPGDL